MSQVEVEEGKDCKNDWLSQLGLEPTRVTGGGPRALRVGPVVAGVIVFDDVTIAEFVGLVVGNIRCLKEIRKESWG